MEGRDEVLRLFLQHQAMLSGFVYTLVRDWDLVEEALQETAVFLCNRWQDFTPGSNFGAWARTLARMRCRELLHQRRRAAGASLDLELHDLADPIAAEEWEEHGRFSARHQAALSQCIEALPRKQRSVVQWRYQDQERCERIAGRLAKNVEAVYMMLTRIRKRLKLCVESRLAKEAP